MHIQSSSAWSKTQFVSRRSRVMVRKSMAALVWLVRSEISPPRNSSHTGESRMPYTSIEDEKLWILSAMRSRFTITPREPAEYPLKMTKGFATSPSLPLSSPLLSSLPSSLLSSLLSSSLSLLPSACARSPCVVITSFTTASRMEAPWKCILNVSGDATALLMKASEEQYAMKMTFAPYSVEQGGGAKRPVMVVVFVQIRELAAVPPVSRGSVSSPLATSSNVPFMRSLHDSISQHHEPPSSMMIQVDSWPPSGAALK
mmetsp:Transcript_22007/g.36714  ORF Transcript_22007/g.36714 Transcript_22007/m.36714 type:complete len:258 (+) Transcript_22007:1019-1792(+)